MNTGEPSYKEAFSLAKRINTLRIDGKDIQEYFLYEEYNFWQAFQTDIFINARRYTADPKQTLAGLDRQSTFSVFLTLTAFLVSLCALLVSYVRNVRILIYTVDKFPHGQFRCDFRLRELYECLNEKRIPYTEVVSTPSGRVLMRHTQLRKRTSIYTAGGDLWSLLTPFFVKTIKKISRDMIDTSVFTEAEIVFVLALLRSLFFQFALVHNRVRFLRFVLRTLKVSRVYLIDDVWHYFELLVACEKESVSSVSIQHGHFTKYHVGMVPCAPVVLGTIIQPRRLFVWTSYWKKELVRLGSYMNGSNVVVAGIKTADPERTYAKQEYPIGVLVPYETDAPKSILVPYLKELKNAQGLVLYFKPRSDLQLESQLRQYGFSSDDQDVVVCTTLSECASQVHVAIGTYTSLLYDMIGHRISVILLTSVLDYGDGMITNGIARSVHAPHVLIDAIHHEVNTDAVESTARIETYFGRSYTHLAATLRNDLNEVFGETSARTY